MRKKTSYKIVSGLIFIAFVYLVTIASLYRKKTIKLVRHLSDIEWMTKIGLYGSVPALLLLSAFVLLVVGCCLKQEQLNNPSQELEDLRAKKQQILGEIDYCVADMKLPTEIDIVRKIDVEVPIELESLVGELYDARLNVLESLKCVYMDFKQYIKESNKSYSSSSFDKDRFDTKCEDFCKRSDKLYYGVKRLLGNSYGIEKQIKDKIDALEEEKKISQYVINALEDYLRDSFLENKINGFTRDKQDYLSCIREFVDCISAIQELEKIPASSFSSTAGVVAELTQQASSV